MKRSGFINHALGLTQVLEGHLESTVYDCMPHPNKVAVRRSMIRLRRDLETARHAQTAIEEEEMRS